MTEAPCREDARKRALSQCHTDPASHAIQARWKMCSLRSDVEKRKRQVEWEAEDSEDEHYALKTTRDFGDWVCLRWQRERAH